MRTDRSYRNALAFETAMEEILKGCGSQFDPAIVTALIAVVERDDLKARPAHALAPAATPRVAVAT
jgi:HD-GYP domain-containing protein (c-di-GMP phosphodiesterase class II)